MEAINWHTFFFLLFGLLTSIFAVAVVIAGNVVRMAFYLIMSLGATSGLFFLAGADFVAAMQLMIYVGGTLVLLIFGVMLTAQGPFISMKTGGGEWILATIVGGSLLAVLLQTAFSVKEWRGNPRYAHAMALVGADATGNPKVVIQAEQPGTDYAGIRIVLREAPADKTPADKGKKPVDEQESSAASLVRFNKTKRELVFFTNDGNLTAREMVDHLAADKTVSALFLAAIAPGVKDDAMLTSKDTVKTAFHGPNAEKTATALGLGLLGARVDQLQQPDESLRRGMSGYLLPFEIVSMHLLVVLIGAAYIARTKRRANAKTQA